MSLLTANNLSMSFGPLDVFDGVSCAVAEGDRIGLVGPNGEGKTTLLRILAGELTPTAGGIYRRRGLRMGYLPQDPPQAGDRSLWEDMLDVFSKLRQEEKALQELETRMADSPDGEAILEVYAQRQHDFEVKGGYDYPLRIRQTLSGLGFRSDQFNMPLTQLSGGQRTRALLARLLLEKPDLLLMDEPTNHLDLAAVEWLENALLNWQGGMVIVAHDRYFLDRVATRIWEMAWGEMTIYRGAYSQYVVQREERLERLQKEYEAQQAFIAKEEDYIRRNIAGQNTRQAQGRRTRLQRMMRDEGIAAPRRRQRLKLHMNSRLRSGGLVLKTKNLAVGYRAQSESGQKEDRSGGHVYRATREVQPDDTYLFKADELLLERQERVGVIGPNGAGKTTFVKTLLGKLAPLEGELRIGASIRIGYLAQVQAALDPKTSVLDTLLKSDPRLQNGEARSILARFLFTGDAVLKNVEALSGGQRSRLALAQLSLQKANFLVLDEPTNHLDIESQEVLEDMLNAFDGTVLLVSHDRYLIEAVATQVWLIDEKRMRGYEGNYSAFVAARQEESAKQVDTPEQLTDSQHHRRRSREDRRKRREEEKRQAEADAVEQSIQGLENELLEISAALERASQAQQLGELQRLGERYVEIEREMEQLIENWAGLV